MGAHETVPTVRWSLSDVEALAARGLTDGLPVVPPMPVLVEAFVAASGLDGDDLVAIVAPLRGEATVTAVAANAVMAGCVPELAPVVLAAVRAISRPEFNLYGVRTSHHPATPLVIVSGPVVHELGFNASSNVFGPGSAANATVGRAVNLVIQNIGGAAPLVVDNSVMGHPGRYTFCIAEREDGPWPSIAGDAVPAGESAVTCFAGDAPSMIIDYASNHAADLVPAFAFHVANIWRNPFYLGSDALLLTSPAHARVLAELGGRPAVLAAVAAAAREICGPLPLDQNGFDYADRLRLAVTGGPDGQYSSLVQGWVGGDIGSIMTTEEITR
jgi:hypothetical protein